MKDLTCIIVEDEPIAVKIIKSYLENVGFIKLLHVFPNAIEAMNYLGEHSVDLMFLDIHLPVLRGIDFLKELKNPPKVIITTAYKDYAVEGFDLEVSDYLLKPFSLARFLKAINKVRAELDIKTTTTEEYYFFNVNKKQIKVFFNDILYIESLKDYVKVFYEERHLVTKFQLGEIEALLPVNFLRIHRGYIINTAKITAFNSDEIEINEIKIPIGRTYAEAVKKYLKR